MSSGAAANEGTKTEEGMMMLIREHKFNQVAVADPPERQALVPEAAEPASDIVPNGEISYCEFHKN
jgi:hypothetical protein